MAKLKKEKNIDEQIEMLSKTHGLIIANKKKAIKILKLVNYYTIRGYGEYGKFIDETTLNKPKIEYKYKPGVTLEQIYNLYLFDHKLKKELMTLIGLIEKNIRIMISIESSTFISSVTKKTLGPECYFKKELYSSEQNFKEQKKEIKKQIKKLTNTRNQINQYDEVVQHHIHKYNKRFPIWVLIEYIDFGHTISFAKSLHPKVQRAIFNEYQLNYDEFYACLELMRIVRNKCAHFNRTYARLFHLIINLNKPRILMKKRNMHTMYDLLRIIRYFMIKINLKDEWYRAIDRIEKLVRKNSDIVKQYCLGFPENWYKKLK